MWCNPADKCFPSLNYWLDPILFVLGWIKYHVWPVNGVCKKSYLFGLKEFEDNKGVITMAKRQSTKGQTTIYKTYI